MTFRWTQEALDAFHKRMAGRATGIKTHTIANAGESSPGASQKRGGRRPSKYGNVRTEARGLKFDSKREATRWMDLRLEEQAGVLKDLQRQVVYPLLVNGNHICDYRADFVYERDGLVVEDVKGFKTPEFRLKAKLMLACHGITILET